MTKSRRELLRQLSLGSAVTLSQIPIAWSRPVVESVLLPAHAQTTTDEEPDPDDVSDEDNDGEESGLNCQTVDPSSCGSVVFQPFLVVDCNTPLGEATVSRWYINDCEQCPRVEPYPGSGVEGIEIHTWHNLNSPNEFDFGIQVSRIDSSGTRDDSTFNSVYYDFDRTGLEGLYPDEITGCPYPDGTNFSNFGGAAFPIAAASGTSYRVLAQLGAQGSPYGPNDPPDWAGRRCNLDTINFVPV